MNSRHFPRQSALRKHGADAVAWSSLTQAARRAVKAAKKAERDGKAHAAAMKMARSKVLTPSHSWCCGHLAARVLLRLRVLVGCNVVDMLGSGCNIRCRRPRRLSASAARCGGLMAART